jgi:isopentenyldiphosphate isomerase
LVGALDKDQTFSLNETEVADYRWISCRDLLTELEAAPRDFVTWFVPSLQIALESMQAIQSQLKD